MSNDNTINVLNFPVALDPSELISVDGNTLKTTTLQVAETFGKRHRELLRKVSGLDCSPEFTERNFALCSKNNELQNGKPQKYYEMTKDGFVFLVMSFTGKKAAQIKEAYINAFNFMADKLFGEKAKLSPEQQRAIQEAVAGKLEHVEPSKKKSKYPEVYGRIKSKFRVGGYKDILSIHFLEVMVYIEQMQIKGLEHKQEEKAGTCPMDGRFFVLFRNGKATFTPLADGTITTTVDRFPDVLVENVLVSNRTLERLMKICTDRLFNRASATKPQRLGSTM